MESAEGHTEDLVKAIGTVWKNHKTPAYAVVGEKSLATALSQEHLKVFLLEPPSKEGKQEKDPCDCKDICEVSEWKEIETCVRR